MPRLEVHLHLGDDALPHARGAPTAEVAQLDFALDGVPLGGSKQWSEAAQLTGPAIAACLAALPRDDERLLVSLSSALPHHETRVAGEKLTLRSQDAAYLRFVLGRGASPYAFHAYGDDDSQGSELILEPRREWLDDVVSLGWDWYSFRAYVVERPTAAFARDLVERRDPALRRRRELERCVCVAEDWADGTALRITSARLSEAEIAARVDVGAARRALRR